MFYSRRESRLWIATAAVVAAIYSSLAFTPILAGWLKETGLLVPAFLAGMGLVAATILVVSLGLRPRGAEVGVALGVMTAYFMVLVRLNIPERSHLIEYGVVAVLIHEALIERASGGRRVGWPWLIAILATSLIGAIDEGIQALLPNRVFAVEDIIFNVLAAVMAVAASAVMRWARRRLP